MLLGLLAIVVEPSAHLCVTRNKYVFKSECPMADV